MAGKNIKQLTQDFMVALKLEAKDEDQLFLWMGTAATTLAQRQQQLQELGRQDLEAFLKVHAAEFKAARVARKAERVANGEED